MGSMNKEQSFKLLDAFVDAGGNAIDTANNYREWDLSKWRSVAEDAFQRTRSLSNGSVNGWKPEAIVTKW